MITIMLIFNNFKSYIKNMSTLCTSSYCQTTSTPRWSTFPSSNSSHSIFKKQPQLRRLPNSFHKYYDMRIPYVLESWYSSLSTERQVSLDFAPQRLETENSQPIRVWLPHSNKNLSLPTVFHNKTHIPSLL